MSTTPVTEPQQVREGRDLAANAVAKPMVADKDHKKDKGSKEAKMKKLPMTPSASNDKTDPPLNASEVDELSQEVEGLTNGNKNRPEGQKRWWSLRRL